MMKNELGKFEAWSVNALASNFSSERQISFISIELHSFFFL